MSRQRILTTVLACAVSAAIGGTAWADDIEITASDIILRKVIYNPDFDPAVEGSELVIPNPDSPSGVFVKNVSHNPEFASAKAKMNAATIYVPAQKADGTPLDARVDGDQNDCVVGDVVKDADGTADDGVCQVQPIVVSYEEEVEGFPGVSDVYVAISLDDGATYKKYNLSRTADRSSFTTEAGVAKYGDSRKPVQQVKGNYIAVAWTDKFCSAGQPLYAEVDDAGEPLYEDLYGVRGSQGSINYDEDRDPDIAALGLGEVPFSCVWASRVTMNKLGYMDPLAAPVLQVYKAERLTSGRRDALQLFMGGAGGEGFAIAWQEDPDGLRLGSAEGPGDGGSGATTNNQTDIWYSYIGWGAKFSGYVVDEVIGGDPQSTNEDGTPRVRAVTPFSMPVRITDNASCNADNWLSDGRPWCSVDSDADETNGTDFCEYFETIGEGEDAKDICVTPDGRLLNGDTGASRPNLFLQPYTDEAGNPLGAWAILAYEETKGLGEFVPDYCDGSADATDEQKAECDNFYALFQGKDVYYHSFDFENPEVISPGLRVNMPYVDPDGNRVYLDESSAYAPGLFPGDARYLTENARRIRFILQGAGMIPVKPHRTSLLALWKQGIDGKGGPSDIMMARMRARDGSLPNDKKYDPYQNPYDARNFVCEDEDANSICLTGRVQNLSAVTPTAFSVGTNGSELVSDWTWQCSYDDEELPGSCNLFDQSYDNPYDNAIAHRGQIRSDFVVLGFSWTPNWAAARNANDHYDFYVRRSFDGGKTWTTDPNGPATVQHCERDLIAQGEGAALNCFDVAAGDPEPPRNVSLLKNNKFTVAEPRIVSPPGTIKACTKPDGTPISCIPEDVLAKNVVFISYGTAVNADENVKAEEELDEEEPIGRPADLFYARTTDFGSTFEYADFGLTVDDDGGAIDHTDPEVTWDWTALAKDQGGIFSQQGEAQLRSTPAGNYFYATWLEELEAE